VRVASDHFLPWREQSCPPVLQWCWRRLLSVPIHNLRKAISRTATSSSLRRIPDRNSNQETASWNLRMSENA
jgi:hypothetical protein